MLRLVLMKVLGVDWGQKKIGLALSYDGFAEPYGVVADISVVIAICQKEGIGKIVLGLPEGKFAKEVRAFGRRLSQKLGIEVVFWGEVFSSETVKRLAIEAGKGREKRKDLHAQTAALLLSEYLTYSKT